MRLKDGTEVEIGWDGVPLKTSPYLAFDTETDARPLKDARGEYLRDKSGQVIPGNDLRKEVPTLACLQVTNGRRHVIVEPENVARFVNLHKRAIWVGHNVAFDWHVIESSILSDGLSGEEEWLAALRENRIRDTMLLDFLARLADASQAVTHLRNLDELCVGWLKTPAKTVDKKSDYRLRFGELIGADWAKVDPGFWEYAAKDAIVTHKLYAKMAAATVRPARDGVERHGPYTECLQSRAAVVLAEVGRNGFALDASQVGEAKDRLKLLIDELAAQVEGMAPGVFKRYKVDTKAARAGDLMLNRNTDTPQMNQAVLREALSAVAVAHEIDPESLPKTEKTGLLTTALDPWRDAAGDAPLVKAWCELTDNSKLHQFLCQLHGQAEVNASYVTLVRTGRTSCRKPNVQQIPRAPWMRGLFVARPGCKLVIVDYSAIELVTLAAVCLDRFGESVLAEQIKAGRDPHAYTAALVRGVDYDGFLALKNAGGDQEADFKLARQAAKAINFGVPGGLGSVKLAAYAKANYGVTLDPAEAKQLRDKLITDVYPELSRYLADSCVSRIAASLGKTDAEVRAAFAGHLDETPNDWFWVQIEAVVAWDGWRNGKRIWDKTRNAIWDALADLTQGTRLYAACRDHRGDNKLWRQLAGGSATTLTGRVRAGLSYTEARNTPFQGLAADGAKVALYRLWERGHRIVAFVHDEIVVEVPESEALRRQVEIERVMCESMASVLNCDIPVKVEGVISERWVKG